MRSAVSMTHWAVAFLLAFRDDPRPLGPAAFADALLPVVVAGPSVFRDRVLDVGGGSHMGGMHAHGEGPFDIAEGVVEEKDALGRHVDCLGDRVEGLGRGLALAELA